MWRAKTGLNVFFFIRKLNSTRRLFFSRKTFAGKFLGKLKKIRIECLSLSEGKCWLVNLIFGVNIAVFKIRLIHWNFNCSDLREISGKIEENLHWMFVVKRRVMLVGKFSFWGYQSRLWNSGYITETWLFQFEGNLLENWEKIALNLCRSVKKTFGQEILFL